MNTVSRLCALVLVLLVTGCVTQYERYDDSYRSYHEPTTYSVNTVYHGPPLEAHYYDQYSSYDPFSSHRRAHYRQHGFGYYSPLWQTRYRFGYDPYWTSFGAHGFATTRRFDRYGRLGPHYGWLHPRTWYRYRNYHRARSANDESNRLADRPPVTSNRRIRSTDDQRQRPVVGVSPNRRGTIFNAPNRPSRENQRQVPRREVRPTAPQRLRSWRSGSVNQGWQKPASRSASAPQTRTAQPKRSDHSNQRPKQRQSSPKPSSKRTTLKAPKSRSSSENTRLSKSKSRQRR